MAKKLFTFWLVMISFIVLAWAQTKEYSMDEFATCMRTITVDDSGVRLIGRGTASPSNPPTECIVYLQSIYARDDGSNKLQIKVESLNIRDCNVKIDLYNGRVSVGQTLQALSCQYSSTSLIYSTGREVTVKFSRPDRIVFNDYQFSLEIKPYTTPDTTTYTTNRRVETASIITAASTPSPVRHDFKCHLSSLEVFLPVSLAPNAALTMKDPTCQLRNNGSHYVISFGYDECGTSQTSYSGSIIVQNEINVRSTISKFDLVEFVDDYTIPLQCTVLRNKTLHTAIQIAPRESFIESYQRTLDYQMKEYTSASYQDEITQYPSKVPINREIFLELSLTNPGSNTTGIRVDKCEATTTTDPGTNPRYLLISNGCPSQNIVKILPRPGLDKFRFSFQAFHFSGSVNQNNVINVHCYVTGCEASACNDVCSGNVRRKRRSTRRHLVSLTSGTYIVTN